MKIKFIELFAGVGGFRLGLEGWQGKSATCQYKKPLNSNFEAVWSNQYEPATKLQHASLIYENCWKHSNHNRTNIFDCNYENIPEHDLLVGGFPCQEYSIATSNAKGLVGEKAFYGGLYTIF